MHIRPTMAVRKLRGDSLRPYAIAAKVVSLASLIGHSFLDQTDRPRRPPRRAGAKRVIRLRNARITRAIVLAHLLDRARCRSPDSNLFRRLSNRIWANGGLAAIADTPPSDEMIAKLKARFEDVDYVTSVVAYLLKTRLFPEDGISPTIEDAKGFVWKWFQEYSVSQITQIWLDHKLVAPYLFALQLEKSFRPTKIESANDVINWATTFVSNPRRVDRLLGHAAFAMDVLSEFARDQRELDFVGVRRIRPPLKPFTNEEKLIAASVDRADESYGRSFRTLSKPTSQTR